MALGQFWGSTGEYHTPGVPLAPALCPAHPYGQPCLPKVRNADEVEILTTHVCPPTKSLELRIKDMSSMEIHQSCGTYDDDLIQALYSLSGCSFVSLS